MPLPRLRSPGSVIVAALAAVLLSACATGYSERPGVVAWSQLGPEGSVSLRAVVGAGEKCPSVQLGGARSSMQLRAAAGGREPLSEGNPAFDPPFPVSVCELALPAGAAEATLGEQRLPLPAARPQRIVVLGDTGCRIKVAASGKSDPLQDCTDPDAWPWAQVAAAAARTGPDLVIHVGDYHYREYCDDPARCQPLRDRGVVVSYGWAGWQADFFAPAAPLLAAAPWVFVRGNHENCDRAGEGWMRLLAPGSYQPCPDQRFRTASRSLPGNNLTADAYRIPLAGGPALVVLDNAAHEDYRPTRETPGEVARFAEQLAVLRRPASGPTWLLVHKPLWYELLDPARQPNALQEALRLSAPVGLQAVFSGHMHAFATLNFSGDADLPGYPAGRPVQVVTGGGGTQLEAFDLFSPFHEAPGHPGSRERREPGERLHEGRLASSGIHLNRYGFLLLERDERGWAGSVMDVDGVPISRCRLDDGVKTMACAFPEPASR